MISFKVINSVGNPLGVVINWRVCTTKTRTSASNTKADNTDKPFDWSSFNKRSLDQWTTWITLFAFKIAYLFNSEFHDKSATFNGMSVALIRVNGVAETSGANPDKHLFHQANDQHRSYLWASSSNQSICYNPKKINLSDISSTYHASYSAHKTRRWGININQFEDTWARYKLLTFERSFKNDRTFWKMTERKWESRSFQRKKRN